MQVVPAYSTLPPHIYDSYGSSSRNHHFSHTNTTDTYIPSSHSHPSYNAIPGQSNQLGMPSTRGWVHGEARAQDHSMYSVTQQSMISAQAPSSSSHPRYSSPSAHSMQYHIPQSSWQATHPQGPPTPPPSSTLPSHPSLSALPPAPRRESRRSPKAEAQRAPNAALLYAQAQVLPSSSTLSLLATTRGVAAQNASTYGSGSVPRLPPILQVEKQQVTTSATQAASASRRRNEANFVCPVPGCGSTFTRRFNLRGHLRSHTEERPFVCEWPGCNKGFARQHDCKRHQALHTSRLQKSPLCNGCGKAFSRLDALNRHLRSEGGTECRQTAEAIAIASRMSPTNVEDDWENGSTSTDQDGAAARASST